MIIFIVMVFENRLFFFIRRDPTSTVRRRYLPLLSDPIIFNRIPIKANFGFVRFSKIPEAFSVHVRAFDHTFYV